MGLHDGMSKKSDIDSGDDGGVSVGEVGVTTTTGSTVGGGGGVDDNDDLTNLTWLQDRNLLKSMTSVTSGTGDKGDGRLTTGGGGTGIDLLDDQFGSDDSDSDEICGGTFTSKDQIVHFIKEENENVYPDDGCSSLEDDTSINKDDGCNNLPCSVPPVPYNPKIHIHAKPPYSFSSLIFMAIESSPSKALPVKDIYAWVVEHFPYYQNSPSGWKNTVRHNLSLNKCFKKLDKGKDELVPIVGKGSLWCVDPDLRPNLLQAVRRTPAHIYPYMSTAKTNFRITPINELTTSRSRGPNDSRKILTFDQIPQMGNSPLLGKRLLIPIINRESEETDAAQSMLTLTRYNSDEPRSLITNIKGEPSNETLDEDGDNRDDDDSMSYNNPTGDHNYFSRSGESKKQNNMRLLFEAQKLINPETTVNTKLTTGPSITNPLVKVISDVSTTVPTVKTCQKKLPTESDFKEKIPNFGDKKSRGTVLMKRKVDVNDEDGLKGAQALLNLASRGLEGKMKEDKLQPQSSISLPLSLPTSVKNIIDNVTNASMDINSITMNKRRRERGRD